MQKEDVSREQEIVDQAQKMQVVDELKAHAGDEHKERLTLDKEGMSTVAEYIHYLENQIECRDAFIDAPPSPKQRDWVQKDIQIIMKDSGSDAFLEGAKIINLSGRVLVHRSERDFIKATLDEAPANMRFTLIEEMPRVQKQVVRAVTSDRNVTITFDDGSTQIVPLPQEEKEKADSEWD